MHHAFTQYMLPNRDGNGGFSNFPTDVRMARQVWYRIGPRAFTVALHSAWDHAIPGQGYIRPVNGVIDSVMQLLGDQFQPVGFDVIGSPFGGLPDSASQYQVGYDDFRLKDYCDGYIFQRPFSQYETVHFVEDFINAQNYDLFRRQVANPWHRNAALEQSKDAYKRQLDRERQMYLDL